MPSDIEVEGRMPSDHRPLLESSSLPLPPRKPFPTSNKPTQTTKDVIQKCPFLGSISYQFKKLKNFNPVTPDDNLVDGRMYILKDVNNQLYVMCTYDKHNSRFIEHYYRRTKSYGIEKYPTWVSYHDILLGRLLRMYNIIDIKNPHDVDTYQRYNKKLKEELNQGPIRSRSIKYTPRSIKYSGLYDMSQIYDPTRKKYIPYHDYELFRKYILEGKRPDEICDLLYARMHVFSEEMHKMNIPTEMIGHIGSYIYPIKTPFNPYNYNNNRPKPVKTRSSTRGGRRKTQTRKRRL